MKEPKNLIAMTDFYFTCLLMCKGFKLVGSENSEEGVWFIIEKKNEELYEKLKKDYEGFDAVVNMSKFVKNTARLRKELDKYKNIKE